MITTKKYLINLLLISILFLIILYPVRYKNQETKVNHQAILGETTLQFPIASGAFPQINTRANPLPISAVSALAIDLKTKKILYEKNSSERWPTASLAKLMTALVVINTISLDDVVTVEKEDLQPLPPKMGLFAGEKILIRDLLQGMLIASDNDASYALARVSSGSVEKFVELMNQMAKKIGLNQTHFQNPAGFDHPNQYTTAKDLVNLALVFLQEEELAHTVQIQRMNISSVDGKHTHRVENSNKLLNQEHILGVKTGYTDEAKGNLILLASDKQNNQILTIILGSGNREIESSRLIDWVFAFFDFSS